MSDGATFGGALQRSFGAPAACALVLSAAAGPRAAAPELIAAARLGGGGWTVA
jgi:hypothetical protein